MAGVLAGASVPAAQGRDGERFIVAVDVDLVVFNVTVTDGRGRHVSGLTADHFRVREEGRLQQIQLFDAADAPARIGLIVDNSGSMREKRAEVARAALAFMAASHPQDELFVVNFNEKASLGLPAAVRFTSEAAQLRSALLTEPAGLTALYDALALGLAHLGAGSPARTALVVLSDGGDNASRRRLDEVLMMARGSSATIYTVGIYDETNLDRNPRALRQIATVSGGRAYFPDSTSDMDRAWREIAGAIRSQYRIGYESSNPARDGRYRKVSIAAVRSGSRRLQVTTRDGYVAPSGGPDAR